MRFWSRQAALIFILGALLALPLSAQDAAPAASPALHLTEKVVVLAGMVFAVLQGLKKLLPIGGTLAVLFNLAMSLVGTYAVAAPQEVFSLGFVVQAVLTALGAAGIHSAVRPRSAS